MYTGKENIMTKKNREKMQGEIDRREKIYTPGNIVKGYSQLDKVLSYTKLDGWKWYVTVAECNCNGDIIGPKRNHMTEPDRLA